MIVYSVFRVDEVYAVFLVLSQVPLVREQVSCWPLQSFISILRSS